MVFPEASKGFPGIIKDKSRWVPLASRSPRLPVPDLPDSRPGMASVAPWNVTETALGGRAQKSSLLAEPAQSSVTGKEKAVLDFKARLKWRGLRPRKLLEVPGNPEPVCKAHAAPRLSPTSPFPSSPSAPVQTPPASTSEGRTHRDPRRPGAGFHATRSCGGCLSMRGPAPRACSDQWGLRLDPLCPPPL